ncbi:glycosyltransferase family 9 protein [Pantoea ananatis]|uniref:glycosyltransferase family 9 protein n=1 Tax=Pantoea ananas TaxID=553 RepID=UPI001E3AAEEA|nr:hypothetical protein [Pantoea ananatis]
MSKITKQFAAKLFLSMWKVTGYRVRKIARFSENDNLKSIAIISNTALGDFLFNTPSIRAIKERWPNAKITLVILKRNHPLVEGSNIFDEVLYWGGKVSGYALFDKIIKKKSG